VIASAELGRIARRFGIFLRTTAEGALGKCTMCALAATSGAVKRLMKGFTQRFRALLQVKEVVSRVMQSVVNDYGLAYEGK
jgi:hypothetical protein